MRRTSARSAEGPRSRAPAPPIAPTVACSPASAPTPAPPISAREAPRGGSRTARPDGCRAGPRPFRKSGSTKAAVGAAGVRVAVAGGEGVPGSTPFGMVQIAVLERTQGVTGELELERLRGLLHRVSLRRARCARRFGGSPVSEGARRGLKRTRRRRRRERGEEVGAPERQALAVRTGMGGGGLVVGGEEGSRVADGLHQPFPPPRPFDDRGHLPADGVEGTLRDAFRVDERVELAVRLLGGEAAGEEVAEEGLEAAEVDV